MYIRGDDKSQLGIEFSIVGFNDEKVVILRQGAIAEEVILEAIKS